MLDSLSRGGRAAHCASWSAKRGQHGDTLVEQRTVRASQHASWTACPATRGQHGAATAAEQHTARTAAQDCSRRCADEREEHGINLTETPSVPISRHNARHQNSPPPGHPPSAEGCAQTRQTPARGRVPQRVGTGSGWPSRVLTAKPLPWAKLGSRTGTATANPSSCGESYAMLDLHPAQSCGIEAHAGWHQLWLKPNMCALPVVQ